MQKIAMQEYCVHCGKEQYAPAVWSISHGASPCCWCEKWSKKMTYDEYYAKLKQLKEAKNA